MPVPKTDASPGFRRLPFPPERKLVLDTLAIGRAKPMMHALVELDVTLARQLVRQRREESGLDISFTGFMLACIGRAIAANPAVHAMRDCLGHLVIFDDVDATVMVEVDVDGRKFALAHVVRGINRRSAADVSREIRQVQSSGMGSTNARSRRLMQVMLALPGFVRRALWRIVLASPVRAARLTGTLLVTSVGMFGDGGGWGWSAPGIHNLSVVLGGISTHPSADPADPAPREFICVTISANHETVDGAPLARFIQNLSTAVGQAHDLYDIDPCQSTAPHLK